MLQKGDPFTLTTCLALARSLELAWLAYEDQYKPTLTQCVITILHELRVIY